LTLSDKTTKTRRPNVSFHNVKKAGSGR